MATRLFLDTYRALADAVNTAASEQNLTAEQLARRAGVQISLVEAIQAAEPQRHLGMTLNVLRALDINPYALPAPPPLIRKLVRRGE